jgi:APA family basic amino acid/polyamine antiporter
VAQGALKRTVTLLDVIMLGAGAALGASVFSVLAPAAKIAGSGILPAIGIAALPMVVFGIVYAFLASAAPKTGASFEWPREFIHPFAGFLLSWLRVLGQVGQMVTLAFVFVSYANMLVPTVARPPMLVLFAFVFALNMLGVTVATRVQTGLMCMLIVVLAIFAITGIPYVDTSRILPLIPRGIWPVLLAVPLLSNLFMGIESATEIGEEVRNAQRTLPLGIGGALALIGTIYFVVCFVALGLIGPVQLGSSDAPLVLAARSSLGWLASPIIVTAALISLLKSLNATYMIFARSLFAMGRAGLLSPRLGRLDPRTGAPRAALTVAFISACVGLLLPQNLVFLLVASSMPTVLKYLLTCVCALRVVRGRPAVFARARLKLPRALLVCLSWLGVACAIGILALGLADDRRASVLIGVWALLGLLYWFGVGSKQVRPLPAADYGEGRSDGARVMAGDRLQR